MRIETFIGWDNGVTGTLGIIGSQGSFFIETPIRIEQNYTKAKQNISRIIGNDCVNFFKEHVPDFEKSFTLIERPMVNPQRYKATLSAMRALETQQTVLELLGMPYDFIDSKEWQKVLLPHGTKGEAALKQASYDIGMRTFPHVSGIIMKHKDADGILIAEYCRRKYK